MQIILFQHIPFGTAGQLYRSVMPYGTYDRNGDVMKEYLMHGIETVIMLSDDNECLEKAGKNIRVLYAEQGLNVLSLPAQDFGIPARDEAKRMTREVLQRLHKGEHLVVHCSAGIGRTGTFLACLAKEHWALNADDAISWIRGWIPGAVETLEQEDFVRNY